MTDWPEASLDRVRRLRVLASVLRHSSMTEAMFDAPFDHVWTWFRDVEASVPAFDGEVRRLRVRHRDGDRLAVTAWQGPGGLVPMPFDMVLEDGWCLMTAPVHLYVVGMVAEPAGDDRTHVALMEAMPNPAGRLISSRMARHVRGDLHRMARVLGVNATSM